MTPKPRTKNRVMRKVACQTCDIGRVAEWTPAVRRMGQVVSQEDLDLLVGRAARGPRRVVFTNGCFDLLHPGHIRSLEQARSLGDVLVIGLNGDASVRQLKGEGRPLIPAEERAELLAVLAAVDFVVLFEEATPRKLIAGLLPDVLVKGADWQGAIVGREEVEAAGGRVLSLPLEPGYSTTGILEKIRAAVPNPSSPSGSRGSAPH